MDQLNKHAPIKSKIVRANNAPYMNKMLAKGQNYAINILNCQLI